MKRCRYNLKFNFCVSKTLCKLSIVAFVISMLCQVYFSNQLVLKSRELTDLTNHKRELIKEMTGLKYEKSKLFALNVVETRAKELGFVPVVESINMIKSPPLATALVSSN